MSKDKGYPNPNNTTRDQYKRHIDGDITVRGQLEVHAPPDVANADNTDREDQKTYRKKNYIVSVFTLIAVVIYAGLTLLIYCATKKAADATEQSAKAAQTAAQLAHLEQRAWFGPSRAYLKSEEPKTGKQLFRVGEFLDARVQFTNTGRTPALNIRIATTGFIAPIEFGQDGEQSIKFGRTQFSDIDYKVGGNIPPDGTLGLDVRMWRSPLVKQNILDLEKPTHRAVIQGRGTYCDVDDPSITHWFTFAWYLVITPTGPVFSVYPRFNDIGDDNKPCHS